jgi:pimeloyl-ACP methyl ester carboxylesterase
MSPDFQAESVVLVHGLWMNGLEFAVLGRRLRHDHGFDVHTFSYPSLHGDAAEICRGLTGFAAGLADRGPVHLVGHSLGGVLIHRALMECDAGRIGGNAVLLGSPIAGSRAAQGASRFPMLRPLLGPHALQELADPPPRRWDGRTSLGVIAGSLPVGLGQLFAHFDEDSDGTVGVSETRIPGLTDHLVLPHSHFGMLHARDVAEQVAYFLRHGQFSAPSPATGG